ncbi:MAG: hypothetical protein K2Y37_20585 [Pirellulales bacterium]|nr:hypothetical protein [Pirellulales bacterium]
MTTSSESAASGAPIHKAARMRELNIAGRGMQWPASMLGLAPGGRESFPSNVVTSE